MDALSLKNQLLNCGVINAGRDLTRALCFPADENLFNLFLSCSVANNIWRDVSIWLDICIEYQTNSSESFYKSYSMFQKFFWSNTASMSWRAICWMIWFGEKLYFISR